MAAKVLVKDKQQTVEPVVEEIVPEPVVEKKPKREYVLTPFQATKTMNLDRVARGLKEVNSPMIYIYARKGKFVTTESADGRLQVDELSFLEWMNAHNAKQAVGKTKKVAAIIEVPKPAEYGVWA